MGGRSVLRVCLSTGWPRLSPWGGPSRGWDCAQGRAKTQGRSYAREVGLALVRAAMLLG